MEKYLQNNIVKIYVSRYKITADIISCSADIKRLKKIMVTHNTAPCVVGFCFRL